MPAVPDSGADGQSRNFSLGIEGFEYSDLFRAERLDALLDAFDERLRGADAELHKAYLTPCLPLPKDCTDRGKTPLSCLVRQDPQRGSARAVAKKWVRGEQSWITTISEAIHGQ